MSEEASSDITIYADGAAHPNPGSGGYGVVILRDGQRQELSGGFRRTTNNRMELLAVIVALREIKEPKSKVTLYSDSKYVVDMFNGGHAQDWRRNQWTREKGKKPALNPDLWNDLLNLAAEHVVKFVWVRGHADNAENVHCDELAVKARQAENLPADEGYEKPASRAPPRQMTFFDEA